MTEKILIIEDDATIAELERDYLEANGYTTEICADGKSGLDEALKNEYNLILLDVMLPEMDGFEVCRAIRKVKNVPILLATAKQDEIDVLKGFGIGADDYITKPFSLSQLVARVKAHINRYNRLTAQDGQLSDVVEFPGLSIHRNSRRVYVDDNEVIFTNKEFDLLIFLASNPNVVYSKDALFDKIWGFDSIGETSTVTVHINRIREKIEDDTANPRYIETVWGAGYRFINK